MEIINVTDEIIEINVTEAVVNIVTQNGAYPLPSNVFSVFGRVGNVVGQAGDYTTSIVAEGTNLYYTQARFNTAFGNKTTTDLAEGTNLYYTDARSRSSISENITGLEYSSASGIFSLASGYLIPTQAMLDAKVPYTGATGDVTLGEHQLTAGQITFDQTPTGAAGVGVLRWNSNDGTLDLGLKGGNVTLQVGQEMLARVVNKTGADLLEANYQVVRISSAQGQRMAVQLAQANNDANSTDTIGIVTETIQNNQEGFITIIGQVKEINTTGSLQGETWADGDVLYLSPTTAGIITNVKPTAPQHLVSVGYVEYAHSQHGKIFAKIQNGYELEELHDVAATPYIDKGVLYRDTATNLWKSATIGTLLGYTPVTSARTISTTAPLTGGGDLSANRTFAINQSSASADGYLSSTDWSTFNNKQPLIAAGTTAQYYRGDKTFQTLNTTAVAEGTNLYYTDTRARAAITGTAPISVSSGVVSISQAGGAANGYLSSTDWNTFNNKQAALNGTGFVKISGTTISYDTNTYLTTISGIAAGGELSGTYANPSLVNSAVTGKILSGVNITGGSIVDTDSILTAFGKLQNQVNGLIGGSIYKGTWNAATNTPTLTSGVGNKGWYYIVDVYGTTNLDGVNEWHVGDWAIFDGVKWQKVDTTDAVTSVNGQVGAVSLTTSNITEGSNLYFTNARGIGSTLTGYTSGAGVVAATDTILQAIQKLNGNVIGLVTGVSSVFGRTGAVVAASGDYTTTQVTEGTNLYYTQGRFDTAFGLKTTTNLTEGTNLYYTSARFDTAFSGKTTTNLTEGTNLYYTEARVNANANVAANTAARHAAVTIGTANGLSLSTQALSLASASTSTTGALTSTDWNTFNGKQAALNGTGFVKISGTTISYDNSTYLTTSAASSTYLPLAGGTLTGALSGTSATFIASGTYTNFLIGTTSTTGAIVADANRANLVLGAATSSKIAFNNGSTTQTGYIFNSTGETSLGYPLSGSFNVQQVGGGNIFSLGSTGAATFTGSEINLLNAGVQTGQLYADANDFYVGGQTGKGLRLCTNNLGNTRMYISVAGNVGIGTSSPADKLTIFENSGSTTSAIKIDSNGNTIKGHMGIFNNNFYITSNWFYNGSQNADSLSYGQAAITLETNTTTGNILFMTSSAGATNPPERMRINASGNVGIGMTNPSYLLHIPQGNNLFLSNLYITGTANNPILDSGATGGSMALYGGGNGAGRILLQGSATGGNGKITFYTDGVDRMVLNTNGDLQFGPSSIYWGNDNQGLRLSRSGIGPKKSLWALDAYLYLGYAESGGWDRVYAQATSGGVYLTSGATSWTANSDERLKTINSNIENAVDKILTLRAVNYSWNTDELNRKYLGLIAQDVQKVLPELVDKDEKDEIGTLGVRYTEMIPVLVKAIQELKAEIEELKNK